MEDETAVTEMTSIVEVQGAPMRRTGTFGGVFAPTVLSILGVLLFLRLGWVVGNAGLGGALLMLGTSLVITITTGLSLSSIASNTRIGAGGPFEVLTRALGFEISGVIGIPLLFTRPLVVAMCVFGFRDGLLWMAPDLPPMAVDLVIFGVLFAVAYRGALLAFHLQSLVLLTIGASILAIVLGVPSVDAPPAIPWWGEYQGMVDTRLQGTDFWAVFAVFFPATTGFLAGAPTRIDLEDPRRTVPRGTLWAIVLSAVLYVAVLVWCARSGSADELVRNYTFVIDHSVSPLFVTIGLLLAAGTSALAGLVDAPRILTGLGVNRIVPYADAMAETVDDEPRNAMVVTGMLTLGCLLLREIHYVAPILTMLFLTTYAAINLALIVEKRLGLITFRPTFRVPLWVPGIGLIGSLMVMFLVSPVFALVAVVVMLVVFRLVRRHGVPDEEQTSSGMFVTVAEWAASKIEAEEHENPRAWRPNLLVPVVDAEQLRDSYRLLMDLARPEGSIRLMGLGTDYRVDDLERKLARLGRSLSQRDLRTTWSMIDLDDYQTALHVGAMAVEGAFLRPNAMFLRLGQDRERDARKRAVVALRVAAEMKLGAVMYLPGEQGLGNSRSVRVVVRRGPSGWDPVHAFDRGNMHMSLLLAMRLVRRWRGTLELAAITASPREEDLAQVFLKSVVDMARLPARCKRQVYIGDDPGVLQQASRVDLTISGFPARKGDIAWADRMAAACRGSCLLTMDSGIESALI